MSTANLTEIVINGVTYIPADSVTGPAAPSSDGLPYRIVRTQSAGVFAGYVKSRDGKEAVLVNARRLWRWAGAASLSQLAVTGPKKPKECKFTVPVSETVVTEVIEILEVTDEAKKAIDSVSPWVV